MKWNMAVPTVVGSLMLAACAETATAPLMSTGPGRVPAKSITTGGEQSGNGCQSVGGFVKIDAGSGSASGAWGSFDYSGTQVTGTVNAGYTLELCLKYSTNYQVTTITGLETGVLVQTPPTGPNGQRQGISHLSWRVSSSPPTTELQGLGVSKTAVGTFDRTVSWKLEKFVNGKPTKSATYSGKPGQSFPVTWDIEVTKSEVLGNYKVKGAVTITNPNAVSVGVTVADILKSGTPGNYSDLTPEVVVDCDAVAAGNQPSGTVPGIGMLSCTYEAVRESADASLNEANVTVVPGSYTPPANSIGEITGGTATASISWTQKLVGDDEGILTDNRFPSPPAENTTTISGLGLTTKQFMETFTCSKNPLDYIGGVQVIKAVNTATLDIDPTDLTSSAEVIVTCNGYTGETATGKGLPWAATGGAPANWFMYTPWTTLTVGANTFTGLNPGPVDLIAGQFYDVGDIVGSVVGAQRTLTITLQNGAKFTNVSSNVKVIPLTSCAANAITYVQPGQYTIKSTAAAGAGSIAVNVPSTLTVKGQAVPVVCYGIHVDAQRFLFP